MDRMFDRFFTSPVSAIQGPSIETEWSPNLDFVESDKEFVIRLEVPGVHRENLDVNLDGNVLTLSGRREFKSEGEGEEYIWREREEGRFVRALRLPKAVDPNKVSASYHDGVLDVRLLKHGTG